MIVSHRSLIIIAAAIWCGGGISLLFKGGALIQSAHSLNAHLVLAHIAALVGTMGGLLQGNYIFSNRCKENIKRIYSLSNPKIWQCFRPRMLIFLGFIIPIGAWVSKAAAGNYTLQCLMGALDLSISVALLRSGLVFWRFNTSSANSTYGTAIIFKRRIHEQNHHATRRRVSCGDDCKRIDSGH